MILINASSVEKSFAGRTLFRDVSFGLDTGDRTGLVGPNGSGKSTLLKILAGLLEPDAGKVTRKKGLRLGYLEQNPKFEDGATILSAILKKVDEPAEALAKAYGLISQLDLTQFGAEFPVKQLSGGWQKRVALARELLLDPELMLLDEPTNHLDVSSILWLEELLENAAFSVLMITHDRLFLQRVANRILDLDQRNPGFLLSVKGDYTQYLASKEQELAALRRHEQVFRNTLRRETEWLRRGAKARHKKSQARIAAAGELADTVADLERRNRTNVAGINFGEVEKAPKKLIELKNVAKSYGGKALFENVNLLIGPKTRLALMGDNGSGKSTLIKILIGHEKPDVGSVFQFEGLKISYFEQARDTLDYSKSVLRNLCPLGDHVIYRGLSIHVRSYLDRFLFSAQQADMPISKLSGGEQARLRLAQLMLHDCQVLVLDEPTNDLDADTLDVMENAINEFSGAVILVTHDRYFMDAVADQILAFPIKGSKSKKLVSMVGYLQWEDWFGQEVAKLESAQNSEQAPATKGLDRVATGKARMSYKDKFELENMEENIIALEARLSDLQAEAGRPELVSNSIRLTEIHLEMAKLHEEIEQKYARWSELEAKK